MLQDLAFRGEVVGALLVDGDEAHADDRHGVEDDRGELLVREGGGDGLRHQFLADVDGGPVDGAADDGRRLVASGAAAELPKTLAEDEGEVFERQRRIEATAQFKRLKGDAQAIYGMVRGLPGVRSPEQWAELLEKAGDEIGNGRFLVRCLGAERYLDPAIVAVLLSLRQNLLAERQHPTTSDIMQIDAAVLAYFNMLRVQGWIGNLCLVFEREAFGQAPLNEYHGDRVGDRLGEQLRRLAEIIFPLQDRASKMLSRNLAALSPATPARRRRRAGP